MIQTLFSPGSESSKCRDVDEHDWCLIIGASLIFLLGLQSFTKVTKPKNIVSFVLTTSNNPSPTPSDEGNEESVEEDPTHSSVRDNGDLHIYDLQAYHEASYYCTVSNGRDSVRSTTVKVTIVGMC